jgi:hypothetical protein
VIINHESSGKVIMLRYVALWGLALLSLILSMLLPQAAATAAVNGQCGSANGEVTSVPTNTNLCSVGTASAVTGTGPWIWTCAGSGGGTTAPCSTAVASSCPQGQTYVSAGDGCMKAQATGSVQRTNFFTGFTGQTYTVRPPWNVAGVDYAVGYSGTLKDPAAAGNLPACISSYNANTLIANADMQPCMLDNLDFTLHGGYCVLVTGSGGNTVTFSNDHFATGTSNCTQYAGWIQMQAGTTANILVKYSEFDDNYGCTCGGAITMSGDGDVTVEYSAAVGVTGRFENIGSTSTGSIHNKYNYIEGIGSTYEHGEVVEINTANPYVYSELWNNYYASSTNCCDTALIYMTAGVGPTAGNITTGTASYNVLIARRNPTLSLGGVVVSVPVWVEATNGTIITNLTVSNNYIDSTGSFWPINSYPSDGTGAITNSTCSGNISLVTARLTNGVTVTAGRVLAGTRSSGPVKLVCK